MSKRELMAGGKPEMDAMINQLFRMPAGGGGIGQSSDSASGHRPLLSARGTDTSFLQPLREALLGTMAGLVPPPGHATGSIH